MTLHLLRRTWRWQAVKLLVVAVAALAWGVLIPFIYVTFSEALGGLVDSGLIPEELTQFGSGDLFSLPGAVTLAMQHPLFVAMVSIFAVGLSSVAVAGERQRGTLEVLLARPLSRRAVYLTLGLAIGGLVLAVLVAVLLGIGIGAQLQGVGGELEVSRLPLVLLNGWLLFGAFASFGLAASVTFDRSGPALGLAIAYLLVSYFLEVLGSLWPDAAFLQPYSPFHHFQPGEILEGQADPLDLAVLAILVVLPVAWALVVFPRRDLAAPS